MTDFKFADYKQKWNSKNGLHAMMKFDTPLVILDSPYRSVLTPFFDFLDEVDNEQGKPAMIVLPSFVPGKIWQNILHNQTAAILKTALLYRKKTSEKTRVIVDVPFQLSNLNERNN